jgi:hypothetical protein
MAGDWIKMRKDLFGDPEVFQIAANLELSREAVVGYLYLFWSWVDGHMSECNASNVTEKMIDVTLGCDGFGKILEKVGWAQFTNGGLTIPKFERHLSQGAKKRALTAERVQRFRDQKCNTSNVTDALPEKRREEKRLDIPSSPLLGDGSDSASPADSDPEEATFKSHMDYFNAEVAPKLPGHPKIQKLTSARKKALRCRLEEYPDLWARVLAEIPHLGQFAHDHKFINFDFLVSEKRLQKFLEGFHRRKDINYGPATPTTTTRNIFDSSTPDFSSEAHQ